MSVRPQKNQGAEGFKDNRNVAEKSEIWLTSLNVKNFGKLPQQNFSFRSSSFHVVVAVDTWWLYFTYTSESHATRSSVTKIITCYGIRANVLMRGYN